MEPYKSLVDGSETASRRPKPNRRQLFYTYLLPLAVLIALCAFTFSNSLKNEFHLDDFYRIKSNTGIMKIQPVWRHFLDPSTSSIMKDTQQYRPLLPLTFSFNYALSGFELAGYHLVNIALQALAAVFCYLFFLVLLRRWGNGFLVNVPASTIAFFAAAIFAIHPISGFPINYLSARDLLLMQAFLTASLFAYASMRARGETAGRWTVTLVLLLLSLLSKANAILAPVIIFLFEIFIGGENLWSTKLWRRVLPFAAVVALFLAWTTFFLHFSELANVTGGDLFRFSYLLTQFKLHLFHYLRDFFWPFSMRGMPGITPVTSPFEYRALIGFAFIIATLIGGWLVRRRAPIISFSIFAYWAMMSPESSFIPLFHLAADYRMYPSLPYLSIIISLLLFRYVPKKASLAIMGAMLIYFGVSSYHMNHNFKDERTFWSQSVRYGGDETGTMNYGVSLRNRDNIMAKKYFEMALQMNPGFYLAYINLGLCYIDMGDGAKGLELVQKGVSLSPLRALDYAIYWLGHAYVLAGDYSQAIKAFTQALKLNPALADAYFERGLAYQMKKPADLNRAISEYSQVIRLNPLYVRAYLCRGEAYAAQDLLDPAIADFTQTLKLNSTLIEAFFGRGLAYARKQPPEPDKFLRDFDRALRLGRKAPAVQGLLDRAITDFTKALQRHPALAGAYLGRGLVYTRKQPPEWDQAIANYSQALRLDPENAWGYGCRGDAYTAQGRLPQAIADFTQALKLNPQLVGAYLGRGLAYVSMQPPQLDRAVADYDQALRLDPKNARAYAGRGEAYTAQGRLDRAITDFTQALKLQPALADAYLGRGLAYERQQPPEISLAIADYTQALRLDPGNVKAYAGRGDAYLAQGLPIRAIADFTQALKLNPALVRGYLGRGLAYARRHHAGLEKAVSDFDQALRLDPQNARAYVYRGEAYAIQGQLDPAIADFTQALKLDFALPSAFIGRGLAYAKKKPAKLDQAVSDFDQALRLDPKNARAYAFRGEAYAAQGRLDQAIADFTQALSRDPLFVGAHLQRGLAYSRKQPPELAQALADYNQALRLDFLNEAAYVCRGEVYGTQGQFARAIAEFTQALELNPALAWAYLGRGLAYARKRPAELDRAVADYDQALRLDPGNDKAYTCRGEAYLTQGRLEQAIADFTQALKLAEKNAVAYSLRARAYYQKGQYRQAWQDVTAAQRLGEPVPPDFVELLQKARGREIGAPGKPLSRGGRQ